nr:TIM-barrel domain-containing protein [uncultured Roseateles sp.]
MKPLRLLLLLCLACLGPAWGVPVALGPVTLATPLANGASLALGGVGGSLRIEFLAGGIVHIEATPPGAATLSTGAMLAQTPASGAPDFFDDGSKVFLRQAGLSVIVIKNPLQVVVMRNDGSVLSADLPGGVLWDADSGLVIGAKFTAPDERFFGLGLAGGPLDRRGRLMLMRNSDRAAYEELSNPLYSSTPFFYGQRDGKTYGLFVDNPSTTQFDLGRQWTEVLSIASQAGTLSYYLIPGPTPAEVARGFGRLTGNTALPPRWSLGYLQAHFGYASAAEVLGLAQEFRARSIPADAFFLDLDYTDRLFTMSWNPGTFPDPAGFNAQMAAMGFKRVNILEPLLTVFDPLWSSYAGAGLLATGPDGQPLITPIWMGEVSWIDFTKPAARADFKLRLKNFLATGVSGLWADLNEPAANDMPYARFDFSGQPRLEYASRNVYALLEVAALHEALAEAQPGLRPFIVSRSGFAGMQRYAANWSGDTDSTFDSLRVQVQIAASMGLSGQNLFGADVGGFLGAPNAELFLRWLQFGVATPLLRNHSTNTSPLREPWRFGEPYTSVAKAMIEWRYRLMPYLYGLFVQAERDSQPVLAPTFFHFPADTATHAQSGEYLLGPSLLVAPVFTEGATTRSLYLPSGASWFDYNTDQRYSGGQQVQVAAPLHQLPMFVRAGSIVPMGPVRQFADQVVEEMLLLDVFPGANASFTLHDDDGATTAYRNGAYLDSLLSWTEGSGFAQLDVSNTGGTLAAISRPWWVQVRAWPQAPARVLADGVALAHAASPAAMGEAGAWFHDAAGGRLLVRMPGRKPAQSLRVER